ncbi:MAG: hypothetical protein HXM63_01330 [Megasphaera micronuciformis]|nr:hypothetical protein [Megasphaera micronuciformis]
MSDVIQYAKVIEPCVYKNEFYEVDDIITGTEEEIEQHVHFGYAVPTEEAPVVEEVVEEQPVEEEEEEVEEETKKGKK